jgi:chromosome partitioning protein
MVTIALVGQKGGAGKTTIAVCFAVELERRGRRVLLVDADPQASARTWAEVATEAGHPAPACVTMGAGLHRRGQLDRVAAGFDVVIIDCPPRHGEIQRSALMAADLAVLPCGPSPTDAWALASSLELVEDARQLRPDLRAVIVLTRVQAATRIAQTTREALAEASVPVLRAELGYRVAFQEALAAGRGVSEYAAGDPAATELQAVLDEVLHLAGLRAPRRKEEKRS